MSYGVTTEGFVRKTLEVIKAELEAEYRNRIGAGVNLEPTAPHGQSLGIHAERESDVWELAEAIYNSRRAGSATGASQDTLYALNGLSRRAAARSTVALTCVGTPGTVLPAGRLVSVSGGARFRTLAQATIASYGSVAVQAESVDEGPVVALAGTLTTIETAVSGWTSVVNAADATLGWYRETDSAFRIRREEMLRSSGNAAVDAIRTKLLRDVDGVVACSVFENVSSVTDGDGRPPKSIEVLVQGGTDSDVARAIWQAKAAGIETFGNDYAWITDAAGQARQVYFSRPTALRAYVKVRADWIDVGDPEYVDGVTAIWPEPAQTLIKESIVAWAQANLVIGRTLYSSAVVPAVFAVAGARNVEVLVGLTSPPAGSAVTADARTLVGVASADITFESM